MNHPKSNTTIHFAYVVSMLVALIIFLLTYQMGDNETLASYLNFALGLTSFVVGIVAIIYAFFTNSSFTGMIIKLEDAASNIETETIRLHTVVAELDKDVKIMTPHIETVSNRLNETAAQPIPLSPIDTHQIAMKLLTNFLNASSWNGLKVNYICALAYKNKKDFNLGKWCMADGMVTHDYALAYLVASSSTGLFIHGYDDSIVQVSFAVDPLLEAVQKEIALRMTKPPIVSIETMKKQIQIAESFVSL